MSLAAFYLIPTESARVSLRRYASGDYDCGRLPGRRTYHDVAAEVDTIPAVIVERRWEWQAPSPESIAPDAWPMTCGCGYTFTKADTRQVFVEPLYRRSDGGPGVFTLRTAPPGAMWDAWWYPEDLGKGPDGLSLIVKCPNGVEWHIDGFASNCDAPCRSCGRRRDAHSGASGCRRFDPKPHHCWIRHGAPPMITVDKDGDSCGAGAGSIQAGDYHGFLRAGVFTEG